VEELDRAVSSRFLACGGHLGQAILNVRPSPPLKPAQE
jgi:hypothetical protein